MGGESFAEGEGEIPLGGTERCCRAGETEGDEGRCGKASGRGREGERGREGGISRVRGMEPRQDFSL